MGSFGWVVFGLVLGWVVSAYSDRMIGSDCLNKLAKVPTALIFFKSYMRAFSQERSLVQTGLFSEMIIVTFFYLFILYIYFQRSVCIKHYPDRVPKAQEQTAHACILARTLTGK